MAAEGFSAAEQAPRLRGNGAESWERPNHGHRLERPDARAGSDPSRCRAAPQPNYKAIQRFLEAKDLKDLLNLEKVMNRKREQMGKVVALMLLAYAIGLLVGEAVRSLVREVVECFRRLIYGPVRSYV